MDSAGRLWYVQLPDGDVHRVTLDQLDEGFQAGHVDASTMVLAAGATRWEKLGQLAGIDEAPPIQTATSSAVPPRPAPAPAAAPSYVPRPSIDLAPPTFAKPSPSVLPAPHALFLNSYRPVSVDLSELDFQAALPRRSGTRWWVGLVAVAMVAGLGAVAVKRPGLVQPSLSRLGLHGITLKSAVAAVVPPHLVATDYPAPVTALTMAPVFTPLAVTQPPLPPDGLGDDRKQRSAAPDKPVGSKPKARKAHAATAASHGSSVPKGHTTFTTGGNRYDPLSSSI
jgi:hypothetical protein